MTRLAPGLLLAWLTANPAVARGQASGNGGFANVDCYRWHHALCVNAHVRKVAGWPDAELAAGCDQRNTYSGCEYRRADR
jgi:hypothetical protein